MHGSHMQSPAFQLLFHAALRALIDELGVQVGLGGGAGVCWGCRSDTLHTLVGWAGGAGWLRWAAPQGGAKFGRHPGLRRYAACMQAGRQA